MQLNLTTDYAIRALLFLAAKGRPATNPEIAESMKIPPTYLATILGKLKKAGIVRAKRGNEGGYLLTKEPDGISLLDMIEIMEGTTRINRCLEDDHYCSRGAVDTCPVRRAYQGMQRKIRKARFFGLFLSWGLYFHGLQANLCHTKARRYGQ